MVHFHDHCDAKYEYTLRHIADEDSEPTKKRTSNTNIIDYLQTNSEQEKELRRDELKLKSDELKLDREKFEMEKEVRLG